MNLIDKKKVFHINSYYRISGTSSNFSYKLDITPDDEFDKCCVLKCQIPKSYYSVRADKNSFVLRFEINGENVYDCIVSIPIGNYNRKSFCNALQTALNNDIINQSGYNLNFVVSYTNGTSTADTGKITITSDYYVPVNNVIFIELIFTTNVYYLLGFNANSTYNFFCDNINAKCSITAPNVMDLQLENVIYLRADICQNDEGDNIIADIYTSGEPTFSNILYSMLPDLEVASKNMLSSSNNIYNFYLTDELGNAIDLNGLDINISLMCYKSNRLGDKLKGFINLATLKI